MCVTTHFFAPAEGSEVGLTLLQSVQATKEPSHIYSVISFYLFVSNGIFTFSFFFFFLVFLVFGSNMTQMSFFKAWGWLSLWYTPVWWVNLNRTSSTSPQQGSAPDTECFRSCVCSIGEKCSKEQTMLSFGTVWHWILCPSSKPQIRVLCFVLTFTAQQILLYVLRSDKKVYAIFFSILNLEKKI